MNDSNESKFWLCIGCCFLVFAIGFAAGAKLRANEAIKHNAARYDAKTGDFTWNNPEVEPK